MRTPAVFFDRDGVLNETAFVGETPTPPRSPNELIVPGTLRGSLKKLHRLGYSIVVVTNQPDVARGSLALECLYAIHVELGKRLPVDAVYICPHDNADGCDCRKPKPGLLYQASKDHQIDLRSSWLVGDRWVDIAAGSAAGCRTVLVERPYSWSPTSIGDPPSGIVPTVTAPSTERAVRAILDSASRG